MSDNSEDMEKKSQKYDCSNKGELGESQKIVEIRFEIEEAKHFKRLSKKKKKTQSLQFRYKMTRRKMNVPKLPFKMRNWKSFRFKITERREKVFL